MKLDPVTGPLPREKLAELVAAPYGKAKETIRAYDPMWGRAPGEKFEWEVTVQRMGRAEGTAHIKASSQEEADKIASDLTDCEIDWGFDVDDFTILSVQPKTTLRR